MRLLLDEMLSPAIARALRERGHDVEAIKSHPQWQSLSDRALVALARDERRVIVTNNLRDFRPLHAELVAPGGHGHAGMLFVPTSFRVTKADIGKIVTALEARLAEYPGEQDLVGGVTWL